MPSAHAITEQRLNTLQEQYLKFTRSHIRTKKERQSDLEALINHPMVKHIAFASAKIVESGSRATEIEIETREWLLIGTHHVTISDGLTSVYQIGEFLIYMSRFDEVSNYPEVLLENVSPPDSGFGGARSLKTAGGVLHYAHPHIHGKIGMFCIHDGDLNEIISSLVCGNMLHAFTIINRALHTYGPDRPFREIIYWPSRPLWSMDHESE